MGQGAAALAAGRRALTDYPGAIAYPAHSSNMLGPPGNVPKGWVLHTPEEPADDYPGTPAWFARPNIGGSTTYFVSYLGFVFQCVPENVGAIANGVLGKPYPAWANPNVSLNRQTLSVEIEGYAATIASTISPAQKTALLDLIRHRCQAHGIPIDRQHIIGHYEVATNRSDPGTLNIDALVAELQEDEAPTQSEEIDMFLAKAIDTGRVYVIGPEGKRYLDDGNELMVYVRKLGDKLAEFVQAELDSLPDAISGEVGTATPAAEAVATAVREKLKAEPLR